jgi:RNA-directed DNA polymerase
MTYAKGKMEETMSSTTVSTKLKHIAEESERFPERVFTTFAHLMDVEFLTEAFSRLRKQAAAGLDEVTAANYAENLLDNLSDLHQRMKAGRYRAQPARRAWLPKDDGTRRPLAIPATEDKIAQKAVSMLLTAVYEPMFHGFSYGFRPGRSAHQALTYLREQCIGGNINWIVDADIRNCFGEIDRGHLRAILKSRVNDGAIIRLIGKWLHVGVMEEEGRVTIDANGTPQGGVISPILANIFLHTVLDDWFVREVRPRMTGNCFLVRFADDMVLGFEHKSDAERVFEVLPKRLGRYGLTVHPAKSRLVQFSRPNRRKGKGPGTFDFMGFTHYWGKTRKGGWTIKRKTQRSRVRRTMTRLWRWCKDNRHMPIADQYRALSAKLRGHYQYYGIRGNYKMLEAVFEYAEKAWKMWLGRRSRNGYIGWAEFETKYRASLPLPKPHIVHSF